ncbi:M24 family metallopeptidase [Parahaliea aestuarii]|uniref:Aminopeptidase P family protein n=1 Tax=Parahaliea aestuarii TaxID=1852021 RepID=A0A5C9A6V4_9GAMM|nr:M24 family metallopeptidase [Parahaliea aestuarii]TXS94931.1 aminopeptidase P family protein [Parahaliea aestuarii]
MRKQISKVLGSLLIGGLLGAGSVAASNSDMPGLPDLQQRAAVQDRWLKERLDTLVPALMREAGVDMWVLIAREYNEDPVLETMLPATWMSARRRMVLVFHDRGGDLGVERLAVARYPVGDVFPSAWDPEAQPDQWGRVTEIIKERNPQNIAINISSTFPLADGLSVSQYRELREALGESLSARLVSHDALAIGWLETRIPAEMNTYRAIMRVAHRIVERGLSEEVITPGVTTTDEVVWWYRETLAALKVEPWCQPSVSVQRSGMATFDIEKMVLENGNVIQPGDLLHVDFCMSYMGLKTDTQQMAYVLKPQETTAPAGLRKGLSAANAVQDALTDNFKVGRTGNEILFAARKQALRQGLNPTIYTHPIGYHGHGAGPAIGSWEHQNGSPGTGDYPMRANTAYSIELNAVEAVPEWHDQEVRFMLEVDGFYTGSDFYYIDGRQTELLLIPRAANPH